MSSRATSRERRRSRCSRTVVVLGFGEVARVDVDPEWWEGARDVWSEEIVLIECIDRGSGVGTDTGRMD